MCDVLRSVMSQLSSLLVLSTISHVFASFPGSYDTKLLELPHRLQELLPSGLPSTMLYYYAPLHAQSQACLKDAQLYLESLQSFQPWAIQMLDASSKPPSGLMMGHTQDLGNYDQCVSVSSPHFYTQLCVIDLLGLIPRPRLLHPQEGTVLGGLPILINPKVSFCLPASCSLTDVSKHFTHVAARWNLSVHVDKFSCALPNSDPLDALDWMAVMVLCALALFITASTVYEIRHSSKANESSSHSLLCSFSLLNNWHSLFSTVDPQQSFAYLGGLRFLSIAWIILGHHFVLSFLVPAVNWIVLYKELPRPLFSPLQSAALAVDTFLVITGSLIAYFFLLEFGTKQRQFSLLLYYFHRLVRVAPMLLLVLLLAATLSARGEGPLWQSFFMRHKDYCRTNGWTNLLFLNNYIETDHQCCSFTWYLCVDMHLYLLSPLIMFPLLRTKHFVHFGLPLLILAAASIDFLVVFLYKLPAGSLLTRDLRTEVNYRLEYTKTHTRIAPWLIGVGLGFLLHSVKGSKFKMSQWTVRCCWVGATVAMAATVSSISYFHQDTQVLHHEPLQSALYISLHRVAWALAVAWVIFASETGHAGFLRTLLASRVLQPLGRLTFSLYMVHGSVQYTVAASRRSPTYFSWLFMVQDVLGELMLSLGLAIVFDLAVEAPFIRLEKVLLQHYLKKLKQPTSNMRSIRNSTPSDYASKETNRDTFDTRM